MSIGLSVNMLSPFSVIVILILPCTFAAIQCYVGQKLFSLESNMAVCAPFVPYHCAAACEWRSNCTSHASYDVFDGRRTFVSGVLINGKSLMLLCCASMSTQVQADGTGERCAWRAPDSVPVLGPSIRAEPVLGLNHYIRELKMERNGDSRVDVQIEVCQFEREYAQCKEDKMSEKEKQRFEHLTALLNAAKEKQKKIEDALNPTTPSSVSASTTITTTTTPESTTTTNNIITETANNEKIEERNEEKVVDPPKRSIDEECEKVIGTECGSSINNRILTCCKDLSACDRKCLKGVERSLLGELIRNERGCTTKEVRQTLDCLAKKVTKRAVINE